MKKIALSVLVLLCLLIALLVSLPAKTVIHGLPLAQQGVYLSGVTGRWFDGRARLLQLQTPQGLVQLNDLRWQLQWSALLKAQLQLPIQALFADRPLSFTLSANNVEQLVISELNADVSLATIKPFMRDLSVPLDGAVSLRGVQVSIRPGSNWPSKLSGFASLNNLAVSLPMALLDLGSVDLALSSIDQRIRADVKEYRGDYGLSGHITLTQPNAYSLALESQPGARITEQMRQQMRFVLGSEVGGAFLINYSGNF